MEVLKKNLGPTESKIFQQIQVELQTTADTCRAISDRRFLRREARIEAVRFGLNAVKNVGGNAVDAWLKLARKLKKLVTLWSF